MSALSLELDALTDDDPFPPDIAAYLSEHRALPDNAIELFGLTWNPDHRAIAIPIEGFVKFHRGPREAGPKMWWRPFTDQERAVGAPPFPTWRDLEDPDCEVLVGGEFDAMAAISNGILAASGTLGEGTFLPRWAEALARARGGAPITILFDHDDAGRKGAAAAAARVIAAGGRARIARWPDDRPQKWDVTDHFRSGGTPEELREILDAAEPFDDSGAAVVAMTFDPDEVGRAHGESPPPTVRVAEQGIRGDELLRTVGQSQGLNRLPFLGGQGPFVLGWAHLVAGPPKIGKTELLLGLACEWVNAGYAVAYASEEPQLNWAERLRHHADECDWSRVRFFPALGMRPDALMRGLLSGDERIVIVDTWRNLMGVDDENDNSKIAAAVNPIVARCRDAGKTLILTHHLRKGAGAFGEGISGGHALLGSVDAGIELHRVESAPTRRLLRALCRIIALDDLIYERNADGRFELLGDPSVILKGEVGRRAKEALTRDWQTTKAIREACSPKPSDDVLRDALTESAKRGDIERDPPITVTGNLQGRTIKWRLAQ